MVNILLNRALIHYKKYDDSVRELKIKYNDFSFRKCLVLCITPNVFCNLFSTKAYF